jgi:hypothetical protein
MDLKSEKYVYEDILILFTQWKISGTAVSLREDHLSTMMYANLLF